ncbi:hypothetical protein PMAYCL1PPCAC_11456, partial [Pristionchus mayeri]
MSLQRLLSFDDESFDVIDQSTDTLRSISGSDVSGQRRKVKEDPTAASTQAEREMDEELSFYRREVKHLLGKEEFAVAPIRGCSKKVQEILDLQHYCLSHAQKIDGELGKRHRQLQEKEERLADLREQIKLYLKQQKPLLSLVAQV